MPSLLAASLAVEKAVSFAICITSSIHFLFNTFGMKPGPIPWIL